MHKLFALHASKTFFKQLGTNRMSNVMAARSIFEMKNPPPFYEPFRKKSFIGKEIGNVEQTDERTNENEANSFRKEREYSFVRTIECKM